MKRIPVLVATLVVLGMAGSTAVALPPPPSAPFTLWNFLGIPQGIQKIRDATFNRRGNFPGAERTPPLKALADPQNLTSDNPAIQAAAKIKTEEDLAPQKIKALKYLSTVGCDSGCFPEVKEALIAALEDCTEEVRYQAVLAIQDSITQHCVPCDKGCCCSEEMSKKLAQRAYERDDHGCFLEPSERVREAAKGVLCMCCPGGGPVTPEALEVPPAAVEPPPAVEPAPESAPLPPPASDDPSVRLDRFRQASLSTPQPSAPEPSKPMGPSSRRGAVERGLAAPQYTAVASDNPGEAQQLQQPAVAAAVRKPVSGTIGRISATNNTIELEVPEASDLRVGDRLMVTRKYLLNTATVGTIEVTAAGPWGARARPTGSLRLHQVGQGDAVSFEPTATAASPQAPAAMASTADNAR